MILSYKKRFPEKILDGTKKHTIREDPHNRWKAGMKIHHATGMRTKQYNCFKEGECVSTQRVEVFYNQLVYDKAEWLNHFYHGKLVNVAIDNICIARPLLHKLAINDGFGSIEEFFDWFNDDFTGKIIHFTKLRY